MVPNDNIEDPPLIQIMNGFFEKLGNEEIINADLLESLRKLFESGKLSSYEEIANVLKSSGGGSNEDPGA